MVDVIYLRCLGQNIALLIISSLLCTELQSLSQGCKSGIKQCFCVIHTEVYPLMKPFPWPYQTSHSRPTASQLMAKILDCFACFLFVFVRGCLCCQRKRESIPQGGHGHATFFHFIRIWGTYTHALSLFFKLPGTGFKPKLTTWDLVPKALYITTTLQVWPRAILRVLFFIVIYFLLPGRKHLHSGRGHTIILFPHSSVLSGFGAHMHACTAAWNVFQVTRASIWTTVSHVGSRPSTALNHCPMGWPVLQILQELQKLLTSFLSICKYI